MDLFDTLTFAEILGRTTFLGTLSLIVLTEEADNIMIHFIEHQSCIV
jgi:hypothetical protein